MVVLPTIVVGPFGFPGYETDVGRLFDCVRGTGGFCDAILGGRKNMRLSRKGKSVAIEIAFWLTDDGAIHVATNDKEADTFHVAVRSDPTKPSGHPYLYRELAKLLHKMGAPAPSAPDEAK